MRRTLCLYMPYLASDRAQRSTAPPADASTYAGVSPSADAAPSAGVSLSADAPSAARPLVLTRRSGATLLVAHRCPIAARLGVREGMTLGEAQAIAPGLLALPQESHRDRALLLRLAQWALRFGPLVEPLEPDTLLVDVTGCARLFGGEENIARQALAGLEQRGLRARAAIADTIGAAIALARDGGDRVVVAPAGQASAYLAPLPPAALRIDADVADRLWALGVRTIGDLLMLPRTSLPSRFGAALVLRLQQALGETFEGVSGHEPEEVVAARFAFDGAINDAGIVRGVVERLLGDVFAQVLRRSEALRRIDCVVCYEGVPPALLSIGLSRASRSPEHVSELLRRRLETVDLSPGVSGLSVVARETSRWNAAQGELFEPRGTGDDEALACLVDRIANRLGHYAVARPKLEDDHQPELAYRYVAVAEAGLSAEPGEPSRASGGPAERGSYSKTASRRAGSPYHNGVAGSPYPNGFGVGSGLPTRPMKLFDRPVPIRVIALVPDGPPTWFFYRGREYVIARAWGPERLETGWWRGPDVRRDYFRLCADTGEQFWVFHDLVKRAWYLHGTFE